MTKSKRQTIRFCTTPDEFEAITHIVARYEEVFKKVMELETMPPDYDRMDIRMDLTACHCNGMPLDLDRLLREFDDFNFLHDVSGINRHLNRGTGKLDNHFLPRCAL